MLSSVGLYIWVDSDCKRYFVSVQTSNAYFKGSHNAAGSDSCTNVCLGPMSDEEPVDRKAEIEESCKPHALKYLLAYQVIISQNSPASCIGHLSLFSHIHTI
jgi:hypothetical protein